MSFLCDLNPATGEVLAEVPCDSPEEVRERVSVARAAWPAWAARDAGERLTLLARAAEVIARRREELARHVTREMGKTYESALREVSGQVGYIPEVLDEVRLALEPMSYGNGETTVVREPHGVVAAITPWNFPVSMPLSILLPALATGNTVVFKPSEHVPLTGAVLYEILAEVLPSGVVQLVQGAGDVGADLVASDVDMVGFVGSRKVGQLIMRAGAESLKRMVLELGGKDPVVVFADADIEVAAECCVRHSLRNTGQVCCSVERIYVAEEIAEAFEAVVVEKARAWSFGDGFDEGVSMGPLVSGEQRERVERHVADARAKGARVLLGGEAPGGDGFFYPATVIADVGADHAVACEETFGPIVCLTSFGGDEEDAVRLANDTPYGLGASVFTSDLERGRRVANGIRAGQVGVNRYLAGAPGTPWVGARQSGFGFLGGVEGHRQFTTPKTISTG